MQSAVYTFDDLRIVHLDPSGTTLSELRYTEPEPGVSGIAVSGNAIWISYGVGLEEERQLRKLDLSSGAELASFPIEAGIQDIAVRDNLVLMSSTWRELAALDATTGIEQWRAPVTELAASYAGGIAATAAGTWVVSLTESRAVLVDDSGATIETAAFPFGAESWSADDGMHLALDGTTLVLHRRNQITWYAPSVNR